MKAKVARKAARHVKPMRKSTRGKKHTRATAHAGTKEMTQAAAAQRKILQAIVNPQVEFVEVDMEPQVEIVEVYETEGGEEAES